MNSLLDEMVAGRAEWMGVRLDGWYSRVEQYAHWHSDLGQQAAWVGDQDFGSTFRDNVAEVPVSDPTAWANRRLELSEGNWCVTGIRFRDLDVTKPFVDVIASSLPLTIDALDEISAAVVPAYADFGPRALRVEIPDPDALVARVSGDRRFGGASVNQYVIAGLVTQLRNQPRHAYADRAALRRIEPAACVDDVAEMYHRLAEERPDQSLWAHPASSDEVAPCAADGLLFQVLVDGVEAGVAGACREDDHGVPGFQVQEFVLDAAHRRRGFAPAVLQRLIDELPAQQGDTLWGTIHPDNEPSWRNAISVGREVIGGFVWVTPAGLAGM